MQKQELKNKQLQQEQEIEYYIYKDLENVLCMLGELEQILETLEQLEDKSYLPIAINRMILQVNLSNGIHYDQYAQHKNNNENKQHLKNCNNRAKEIFLKVQEERGIKNTNQKVQQISKFYLLNNLSDEISFQQLGLEHVERQSQFNQKVLEKVIWGTQAIDNQLMNLQNQRYQEPTVDELLDKINKRKKHCEEQLKANFNIQDRSKEEIVSNKNSMEIEEESSDNQKNDQKEEQPNQDLDLIKFTDDENNDTTQVFHQVIDNKHFDLNNTQQQQESPDQQQNINSASDQNK